MEHTERQNSKEIGSTAELTQAIIIALSERGHLAVRNNSGRAKFKNRVVRYGVGPLGGGGGDIIVVCKDGIFGSVEVKFGKDRQTEAQKSWETWVKMRGGRAGVARNVEDAINICEKPS